MKVHISALGCKLNQAEAEAWARELEDRGHSVVPRLEEADLHIVNSCAVTREAVRDSDRATRRGRDREPLRTVLTGCAAAGPLAERVGALGVDRVVANGDKDRLVELLEIPAPPVVPRGASSAPYLREGRRVRVSLKIEDGCSMGCSFCIIPGTRGTQRSRNSDEVLAELADLEGRGYAEVVVTGVQISSYRERDQRLCDLVERMLAATQRVRIRLTSIAPWQFDDRLFELLRRPRVCRHVHLSLQSGCAATLRRMRRPDRPKRFARLVERLRREVPGIAVTSDVIVGFPGESEAEWRESFEFVRARAFARLHVFRYSERPGTAGRELPDRVPLDVRRERVAAMRELGAQGARAFVEGRVGAREEVLWERRRRSVWRGTTDNYLRVSVPVEQAARSPAPPSRGALSEVRIVGREGEGARGEILASGAPRSPSTGAGFDRVPSAATRP